MANSQTLIFPLKRTHNPEGFTCGVAPLDKWIRQYAFQAESAKSARTYVMCQGDRVVAYYSLVSSEWLDAPTSRLTKGMPRHPIPLVKLARLAVDQELQGRGIGVIMLLDALEKALLVSKIIGARAIVVDPINQAADSFYSRFGFEKLGLSKEKTEGVFDPRFILIKDIEKLITSSAYSS